MVRISQRHGVGSQMKNQEKWFLLVRLSITTPSSVRVRNSFFLGSYVLETSKGFCFNLVLAQSILEWVPYELGFLIQLFDSFVCSWL